jgi:hypothetical protein
MNLSARSHESTSSPPSGPSTIVSSRLKGRGEWWFRLTAPQEPANATFAQREVARRGRLASVTIVFISLFTLLPLPEAISNIGFLVVLLVTLAIDAFALFVLNRKGHLASAGWLIVTVLDLGFALSFLSMPQGVTLSILPAFDLMAVALMVVVAFFSPRSVFVVMTINSLFIVLWIIFGPHSAEIAQILKTNPYLLFYPSLGLEIFAAILLFLWVNSAVKAIADLDRSEEIVALERREIAQQEEQLILKQQLEDGVQQLLQTHVKAANGDFSARVPLSKENILWKVAYSLNNLLSRLERYGQLQTEMLRTQEAVKLLAENMRTAKANKRPLQLPQRTGTVVDELIVELTSIAKIDVDQSKTIPSRPLPDTIPQTGFRDAPATARRWVPVSEGLPSPGLRNNER